MKKFLLSIALCGTLAAQASEIPEAAPVRAKMSHNIDITAGGGIGSLGYNLQGGRQYPAYTWSAGLGYTWFFVPGTGLQTGVQLTRLGSVASLTGSYVWQDLLTDASGDQYEHRMTFADWYEQQETYLLEIPLGFTLHHYGRNNPRAGVYAALGAKLQIPLFADYRHHSGSVTHSGYYPYWDLTLQDLPDRFITEQTDVPQQGSFLQHLNRWNAAVYMELGTTIRCGAHTELIITAYGQYTVTDLLATPVSRLTSLGFANSRNGYTFMPEYHGLIGTKAVTALHPWTAGIKLGLSVWTGKTDEQKRRELRRLAEEFPDMLPTVHTRDTVYIYDTLYINCDKPDIPPTEYQQ